MKKTFLICGIASSVLYVLINIFVPLGYGGYSFLSHTPSELSAIGAPTRAIWIPFASVYILLFSAFSIGVWKCAGQNRSLRIVGYLMFVYAVVNIYWPPMHMRGHAPTMTDVLHIVWAAVTVLLMILLMAFGATAFGRSFKWYTIISIFLHILFGILTSLEAPNIPIDGKTPFIGLWERINILIFMVWIAVLSVLLLREYSATQVVSKPGKAIST